MKREIVGSASEWTGVLKDLFRQMDDGSITLAHIQAFLEHRDPFVAVDSSPLVAVNSPPPKTSISLVARPLQTMSWQDATTKAYKLLGLSKEHAEFANEFGVKEVPNQWVLPMVKGEERGENESIVYKLTCNKVVAGLRKAGSQVYTRYEDLDKEVTKNDRDPNRDGSYAIMVKSNVEADEENKDKSANMLAREDHLGMTLMERLFLELVYFLATGSHLDEDCWTLCSGSRDSDDGVPCVHWYRDDRDILVDWCYSSDHVRGTRSRSVSVLPIAKRHNV